MREGAFAHWVLPGGAIVLGRELAVDNPVEVE
jgi:hypothetical protein